MGTKHDTYLPAAAALSSALRRHNPLRTARLQHRTVSDKLKMVQRSCGWKRTWRAGVDVCSASASGDAPVGLSTHVSRTRPIATRRRVPVPSRLSRMLYLLTNTVVLRVVIRALQFSVRRRSPAREQAVCRPRWQYAWVRPALVRTRVLENVMRTCYDHEGTDDGKVTSLRMPAHTGSVPDLLTTIHMHVHCQHVHCKPWHSCRRNSQPRQYVMAFPTPTHNLPTEAESHKQLLG